MIPHDEIMLWIDTNSAEIVAEFLEEIYPLAQKQSDIAAAKTQANSDVQAAINALRICNPSSYRVIQPIVARDWHGLSENPPSSPQIEIVKTWEHPIKECKYVMGFIDIKMRVTWHKPGYSASNFSHGESQIVLPSWDWKPNECVMWFESVPVIDSISALIKREHLLQSYCTSDIPHYCIVVSPDETYVDLLKEQNVYFLKYAPN